MSTRPDCLPAARYCDRCGSVLTAYGPEGLCPSCMLRGGLNTNAAPPGKPSGATSRRLWPRRTIGRYRLLEPLGSGGMGLVFKAYDTNLQRFVAIKFLPKALAQRAEALERFKREAQAASALNHPNICVVHDLGYVGAEPFIVMEFLEGQTLKNLIAGKPLPTKEVLALAIQIAQGLEAAHSKGVIHRDIKPGNIFVDAHGRSKLLDFGLAKLCSAPQLGSKAATGANVLSTNGEDQQTSVGATMGTIGYMSPEQALGEQIDARTDVFSFGAVLYEMVTGKPAFTGQTQALIREAILNHAPRSPRLLNSLLSVELERVISKALEKRPHQRYQSMSVLLSDLKALKPYRDSEVHAFIRKAGTARRTLKKKQLAKRHTENHEAYKLYLRGRFFWNRRTEQSIRKGMEFLRQATEADPQYALAYAMLAESQVTLGYWGYMPPAEAFPKAKMWASRALEIDAQLTEAYPPLAMVLFFFERDPAAAFKTIHKVLRLNPNQARVHQVYAEMLVCLREFGRAAEEVREGLALDPLSLSLHVVDAKVAYYAARYEEAWQKCRIIQEIEAGHFISYWLLGLIAEHQGRSEEAFGQFQRALDLAPQTQALRASLARSYVFCGKKEKAQELLREVEVGRGESYVPAYPIAGVCAALGDPEQTLQWLEKAYRERELRIMFLNVDPAFEAVRSAAQFLKIPRHFPPDFL